MEHKLHFLIGEHLKSVDFGNVQKISDPACGGKQHIPLFLTDVKSRDNQLCKVDYMIIKNKKLKLSLKSRKPIIKPTQIIRQINWHQRLQILYS